MIVCVFCSATDLDEVYVAPVVDFAKGLASRGHDLVWGGSDTGLMKVVATGVQDGGGRIFGVSMELLAHKARKNADEMVVAKSLGERKATLLSRADAVVVLVGGVGTLDEATEIIELKKHRVHEKPIVFLNTAGFYDGLREQLIRMGKDGFLPRPLPELVTFALEPMEALDYLEAHVPSPGGSTRGRLVVPDAD